MSYLSQKEKEKIEEKIKRIIFDTIFEHITKTGSNIFSGKYIQLAFFISEEIEREIPKSTFVRCEDYEHKQVCVLKAKTEYDFSVSYSMLWPIIIYKTHPLQDGRLVVDKLLKIIINVNTIDNNDDKEYNKLIITTFEKVTLWQNPYLEDDDPWPP